MSSNETGITITFPSDATVVPGDECRFTYTKPGRAPRRYPGDGNRKARRARAAKNRNAPRGPVEVFRVKLEAV